MKAYPPAGYLVLAAPPASLLLSLPSDWCLVARSSVGSATLPGSCAECYLAAQVEKLSNSSHLVVGTVGLGVCLVTRGSTDLAHHRPDVAQYTCQCDTWQGFT